MSATVDETPPSEETQRPRRPGRQFTAENAAEMGRRSAALRSQRIAEENRPPTDDEIELGLRRRATTSAKDAEVLLRWLARPRVEGPGLGLDELPEQELEALYRRLLELARMSPDQLNHAVSGP